MKVDTKARTLGRDLGRQTLSDMREAESPPQSAAILHSALLHLRADMVEGFASVLADCIESAFAQAERDDPTSGYCAPQNRVQEITVIDREHLPRAWAMPTRYFIEASARDMRGLPDAPVVVYLQGTAPERAGFLLRELADVLAFNGKRWLPSLTEQGGKMDDEEVPF